jgi:hypothetical protein
LIRDAAVSKATHSATIVVNWGLDNTNRIKYLFIQREFNAL